MGLSLGSITGGITDAFSSLTGISNQKSGVRGANEARQKAIQDAIAKLQAGDASAISALTGGKQAQLGAVGQGFDEGIGSLQQIAGLFNPEGIRQGLTVEGLGSTLSQITDPSGPFAGLIADRTSAASDFLGASGLRRSGAAAEAAGAIPTELALGISDTLFNRNVSNPALGAIGNIADLQVGRGRDFGNIEGDFAASLGNIALGGASNEANLITGAGESEAQTELALGKLDAASKQGLLDIFGGQITGGLQGGLETLFSSGAGGAAAGGLGSILSFLSDERLKTNIRLVTPGKLSIYEWDWIPEVKALNLPLMDIGFIAQDVQKVAPEFVHEIDIGAKEKILCVDYDGILKDPKKWQ